MTEKIELKRLGVTFLLLGSLLFLGYFAVLGTSAISYAEPNWSVWYIRDPAMFFGTLGLGMFFLIAGSILVYRERKREEAGESDTDNSS